MSHRVGRFVTLIPLLVAHASGQVTYPTGRIANNCVATVAQFQTPGPVISLSAIQTGDVRALVQGQNLLYRFSYTGFPGFSVATATGPTDVATVVNGDSWVISASSNTLQRFSNNGIMSGNYGVTVAGSNPVAVAAVSAGVGGIGDAWVVNGSTKQLRRISTTGLVVWSQSVAGTPVDVCVNPSAESWVATRNPNQVHKFAANGLSITTVPLPGPPIAVDVDAGGNVAVATQNANQLVSLSNIGGQRFSVPLPGPPAGLSTDPSGHPVMTFPSQNQVRRYSFATGLLICSVTVAEKPNAVDVIPGNGEYWVGAEPTPNPLPQLAAISPDSVLAGGASFTITLDGAMFLPTSVARWNGTDLTTTFVSANRLAATVSAAMIQTPGNAGVAAFNPAPGGGVSNSLSFRIGTARASAVSYGTGCGGTGAGGAVPLLSTAGLPILGQTYSMNVSLARSSAPVVLLVGVSRTTWVGLVLPFSLAGIGAPNCSVLCSGEVGLAATTNTSGSGSIALAVPNTAALLGAKFFHQLVVADAGANSLGLAVTRAAELIAGDL